MPERIRTRLAKLRHSLVLNQYMFSLMGPDANIERLSELLKAPILEGWDEENHSRYSLVLKQYFRNSQIADGVIVICGSQFKKCGNHDKCGV